MRVRILSLAAITSMVALYLTGCAGIWVKEGYAPTALPFEYDGVEYEASLPRYGFEDTYVEFEPQLLTVSYPTQRYESPYSLRVVVGTLDLKFDRVTYERVMIYVPETQRKIELIGEPETYKLSLEKEAYLYASRKSLGGPIELDFETEKSLYLVLEYSFRGPSTEVPEYRREVFKFTARLVQGKTHGRWYPTV